jgi:hypothetical protein
MVETAPLWPNSRVQMTAWQNGDEWTVRVTAVVADDAGDLAEPFVWQSSFSTLDLAGPGWITLCLMQDVQHRLRLALEDGYA